MPADPDAPTGSGLPDLGPRGEGWVVLQVALLGLLALCGLAGPAWGDPLLAIGRGIGTVLIVIGAIVAVLGVLGLRESLTPMPRPVTGGRLVDTGVYGFVRHPIYAGIIGAGFGWALLTASPAALLVAAGLAAFFDLKSRREEGWLQAVYPGYDDYRRRVRKLIPFIY